MEIIRSLRKSFPDLGAIEVVGLVHQSFSDVKMTDIIEGLQRC
jgi:hypothetical protein